VDVKPPPLQRKQPSTVHVALPIFYEDYKNLI